MEHRLVFWCSCVCSKSDQIAKQRRQQQQEDKVEEGEGVGARLLRESRHFNEQRLKKLREKSEEVGRRSNRGGTVGCSWWC